MSQVHLSRGVYVNSPEDLASRNLAVRNHSERSTPLYYHGLPEHYAFFAVGNQVEAIIFARQKAQPWADRKRTAAIVHMEVDEGNFTTLRSRLTGTVHKEHQRKQRLLGLITIKDETYWEYCFEPPITDYDELHRIAHMGAFGEVGVSLSRLSVSDHEHLKTQVGIGEEDEFRFQRYRDFMEEIRRDKEHGIEPQARK